MTSRWLNWSWCLLLTLRLVGWMDLQQHVGLFTSHTGNHRSQSGTCCAGRGCAAKPSTWGFHSGHLPSRSAGRVSEKRSVSGPSPSSWLAASRTVLGLGSITPSPLCGVFSLCASVCVSESQRHREAALGRGGTCDSPCFLGVGRGLVLAMVQTSELVELHSISTCAVYCTSDTSH